MEALQSYIHQCSNRGIITQACIMKMHTALLQCLAETAEEKGRQDYHAGEIHLSQSFTGSLFSAFIRLQVGRNGMDIFTKKDMQLPDIKIVQGFGGKYSILNGLIFDTYNRRIHMPYIMLPSIIQDFADQRLTPANHQNIVQYDRVA